MNERMDEGINSGFSLAQGTSAVRSVNVFIFAALTNVPSLVTDEWMETHQCLLHNPR